MKYTLFILRNACPPLPARRALAAGITCLAALTGALSHDQVHAGLGNEPHCSGENFPTVECSWPLLPSGLGASNFVVREAGNQVADLKVIEESRETSVVFAMHFGAAELPQPAEVGVALVEAFAPETYPAPISMGWVGIAGKVGLKSRDVPTLGAFDNDFVLNLYRNNIINGPILGDQGVLGLFPKAVAPSSQLFDGICKAQALAATRPAGERYVLLISDGRDGAGSRASTVCTREQTRARRDIPIYIIGIGRDIDTAYLQALAADTGGRFVQAAGDLIQSVPQLAGELLRPLHSQYRLVFTSLTAADGKDGHVVDLEIVGEDSLSGRHTPTYTAHFPYTSEISPALTIAGYEGTASHRLDALPFSPGLVITPTVQLREPLTVTVLISDSGRARTLPLAFDTGSGRGISTLDLTPDTAYPLYVVVLARQADGEIKRLIYRDYALRVEPFKGVTSPLVMPWQWLASAWAVAKQNRETIAAAIIAIGALGAAARWVAWRVREMRYRFGGASGPGAMPAGYKVDSFTDRTTRGDDGTTRRSSEDATRRYEDEGNSAPQTQPLAWLKFTDGVLFGQCFPIGFPGREIVIGRSRDLEPSAGHIQLRNDEKTVSRNHARFTVVDGHVVVENLSENSTTRVNGERIKVGESRPIQPGDLLHFADVGALVVGAEE